MCGIRDKTKSVATRRDHLRVVQDKLIHRVMLRAKQIRRLAISHSHTAPLCPRSESLALPHADSPLRSQEDARLADRVQ